MKRKTSKLLRLPLAFVIAAGLLPAAAQAEEAVNEIVFFDGFEDSEPETQPAGWTFLNADGDEHEWYADTADNSNAHSGDRVLTSASYDNIRDGSLTPDNWAITPAIDIPENAELSFWIAGQDPSWPAENMAVYVGSYASSEGMTKVGGDYTASADYQEYRIDLSAYAGQTVYIGFRHYNVTDMFRLNLDDVMVLTGTSPFISSAFITLDAPAIGADPDYTAEIPDGAHYFCNSLAWYDKTGGNTEPVDPESGMFQMGHVYQVVVSLTAETGFEYIDRLIATVNGQAAQVSINGDQLEVSFTFPMLTGEDVCFFENFDSFDGGTQPDGWTFVDADGDGYQWHVPEQPSYAHSGSKVLTSESYDNSELIPLTPDNWAITPAIKIPRNAGLSFWIRGQAADFAAENMAVYVGSSPSVDAMTMVGGDYTASADYQEYRIDLSAYAGQTVYIGFRHYNVTDMLRLNLDDVMVMGDVVSVPEFKGQSLLLSGKIGVIFYMDLPEISGVDYSSSYMTFSIPHGTCTPKAEFDSNSKKLSETCYGFTCYINSIQMAEEITATFHYTENGEEKTVEKVFAAADYFSSFDNAVTEGTITDQPTIDVVHALADFGHYVQPFLADVRHWSLGTDYAVMEKYYTESAAYDFTGIQSAVSSKALKKTGTDSDIEEIRHSLTLDSDTVINVYFKPEDGYSGSFEASVDGGAPQTYTPRADGRYCVQISGIAAHKLSEDHTITVMTNGGTMTVTVSALSYVNSALNYYNETNDADGKARSAVAAVYAYSKAADVYKAAHSNE